jgi:DNA-binding MarR family transcriptional regulator
MTRNIEEDILRSLRRISRAIDLHSRKLANTFGLTGPQLVCLRAIGQLEWTTLTSLSREVSLSQGTVTGIIDRLAARQLITRKRNPKDRRQVTVELTDAGRALVDQAPSPLQEVFVQRLAELAVGEQNAIRDTLNRVVQMMDSETIEAAPVLSTSSVAQSSEEVRDVLEAGESSVAVAAEVTPAIDAYASVDDPEPEGDDG